MILALTVDLPTILPLKASAVSGLLERSDYYLKYSCGERRRRRKKTTSRRVRRKHFLRLNYIYQTQYIIELHLLNERKTLQSKGADDT